MKPIRVLRDGYLIFGVWVVKTIENINSLVMSFYSLNINILLKYLIHEYLLNHDYS